MKETRCLFCSLGCPCALELGPPPWVSSPLQDGDGICARAYLIGTLTSHPERIHLATHGANGRAKTVPVDHAIQAVCERIEGGGPTAIVIDGTFPTEAVEAMLSLAACAPDTIGAVYLPASDEAMLAGLTAAGWTEGRLPGADCDVVLVVGDAFSTHPPIARSVLDAKHAARGNQLLVVSPFAGGTAGFATRAVTVEPGGEAALLLAVARALGADVPDVETDSMPRAAEVAECLAAAEAPAIVLSQAEGQSPNGHLAALAAARIASKIGAPLLPLFTAGNALGAHAAAARHKATPMAEVCRRAVAGAIHTLVIAGTDLVAAVPGLGLRALEAVEFCGAAASFPNATTAKADVALPLGLCCEEPGTVVLPCGGPVDAMPAVPPIGGALTVAELVGRMRDRLPTAEDRPASDAPEAQPWALAAGPDGDGMLLVGAGNVVDFADGSLSAHSDWAQACRPEPILALNPADCTRLGLCGGAQARLRTAGGECLTRVDATCDVPVGVAAVAVNCPQTRNLFHWMADPQTVALRCGPVPIDALEPV
ncbi:hypothetical protein HQ560_20655 [bacterium]|nr:hypothetical protein [bacterium]